MKISVFWIKSQVPKITNFLHYRDWGPLGYPNLRFNNIPHFQNITLMMFKGFWENLWDTFFWEQEEKFLPTSPFLSQNCRMHTCCISARPVKLTWFNRDELWSRVNLLTAYHSLPQLKSCIRGGKITHHLECHHSKNRLTSIMILKKNNFPISLEYHIF